MPPKAEMALTPEKGGKSAHTGYAHMFEHGTGKGKRAIGADNMKTIVPIIIKQAVGESTPILFLKSYYHVMRKKAINAQKNKNIQSFGLHFRSVVVIMFSVKEKLLLKGAYVWEKELKQKNLWASCRACQSWLA